MTPRSSTALLLLVGALGLAAAGCDDDACQPDGSCLRNGYVCDYDDRCKRTCTFDDECGPGSYCVDGLGLCREGAGPGVDAGSGDTGAADGGPVCSGGDGTEGCACFANQTCAFGFRCSGAVCVPAMGEENQPCFPNRTCSGDATCVGSAPLPAVCRAAGVGGIGESCFDTTLEPNAHPCRSLTAACEDGVCRGGTNDACAAQTDCRTGFGCEDGVCVRGRGRCETRSDCTVGQFCCGEDGSPYARESACPVAVFAGDCFDAPSETYAVPCSGHADCAPTPEGSPKPSGISQCEAERGFLCSAPCDAGAPDPGCPNGWACAAGYLGCFEDVDCGVAGLTCVGADRAVGRKGRCRCRTAGGPSIACTSTPAMSGLPTSACEGEANGDGFCVVDHRCEPPRP